MSAFPLLLTKSSYNETTGKMLYTFPSTQVFSDKEVGLITAAFYNCFFNISAAMQNNSLTIYFPSGNYSGSGSPTMLTRTLVLADGYYSVAALNEALQNFCINQNLYYYDSGSGMNVYFLQFQTNSTLYAVQLNSFFVPTATQALANGWIAPSTPGWTVNGGTHFVAPQVFLSVGLGALLGINTGIYPTPVATTGTWTTTPRTTIGSKAPAINAVSSIILRTNLIAQSAVGSPADMLALVPITSQFGALTSFVAPHPVYSPIQNGNFTFVEITFCNQAAQPIKIFDPDITLTLEIRSQNKSI